MDYSIWKSRAVRADKDQKEEEEEKSDKTEEKEKNDEEEKEEEEVEKKLQKSRSKCEIDPNAKNISTTIKLVFNICPLQTNFNVREKESTGGEKNASTEAKQQTETSLGSFEPTCSASENRPTSQFHPFAEIETSPCEKEISDSETGPKIPDTKSLKHPGSSSADKPLLLELSDQEKMDSLTQELETIEIQ